MTQPKSYSDYLRSRGIHPLPPPYTEKKEGDLVLKGGKFVPYTALPLAPEVR